MSARHNTRYASNSRMDSTTFVSGALVTCQALAADRYYFDLKIQDDRALRTACCVYSNNDDPFLVADFVKRSHGLNEDQRVAITKWVTDTTGGQVPAGYRIPTAPQHPYTTGSVTTDPGATYETATSSVQPMLQTHDRLRQVHRAQEADPVWTSAEFQKHLHNAVNNAIVAALSPDNANTAVSQFMTTSIQDAVRRIVLDSDFENAMAHACDCEGQDDWAQHGRSELLEFLGATPGRLTCAWTYKDTLA